MTLHFPGGSKSNDKSPYKSQRGEDTDTEKAMWWDRDCSDVATRSPQSWARQERVLPRTLSRDTLILNFWSQNGARINFCWFKSPVR